ncbi:MULTISPECIES: helix-turn-helix domain-containing protein [Desulfoluna]|uniref:helix-turn-helix domain-containing protein n=1 Tax=Desulfoluna TaxID=497721 RepID=UPI00125F05E0|nr:MULTISPECIES: helix-turn-helix domain-containing protein [Desulfoluna]
MTKDYMSKDQIKKALKAVGVRPVDLANKADVSRSMVSQVMAGKYPGSPLRWLIANTLNTEPSEIWPPNC